MAHMTTPAAKAAAPNARRPTLALPRYATMPPAIDPAPRMANINQTNEPESMRTSECNIDV